MKSLKTLTAIFILLVCITNVHADKIKIKLHQPPPNLMGVGNMWDLTLDNTTGQDMKIYLVGTASEDKDGLIIEGKSKVFTIKPGRTSYKYNDFSNAEVRYNNGRYREIILRTGNAPEGSYTICITAFDESGEIAGQESCITQTVEQTGNLSLLSPSDGEQIDPDTLPGLTFMWSPSPKGGPYSLKIVELKGDQSPDVAIKESRPILDKTGINMSSFQYGSGDPKLETGKKYAWQVSSGELHSEVWSFSMMSSQYQINIDTVIVRCDSLMPNKYYYQVKVRNNNPLGSPGPTITANTYITATSPVASTITPALNTPYSVTYPNTVTISGSIMFSSATSSVQFIVKMEDNSQPAIYNATAPYTVNLPNCSKNCCEGFLKSVNVVAMNPTSIPGAYKLDLILTAGALKIKKVVGFMSYVGWHQSNEACKKCVNTSLYWGNINSVPSPTLPGFSTVAFTPSGSVNSYSHEVIWSGGLVNMTGGVPVSMYVMFPPQSLLSCCPDTIDFCMKFEFTDSLCVTCDTSFCFRKIRTTQTGPFRIYDEKMEIEKINKELESEQPIEKEEEYKRSKEEQDELMKKRQSEGEGQAKSSSDKIAKKRKNYTAKGIR